MTDKPQKPNSGRPAAKASSKPAIVASKAGPAAKPVPAPAILAQAPATKPAAKPAPKPAPKPVVPTPVADAIVPTPVAAIAAATVPAASEAEPKPAVVAAPAPRMPVADPVQAAPAPETKPESAMTDATKINEQFKANANEATDKVQATIGEFNDRTKDAMERSARLVEEMGDFSRGNIEALVEASRAAARHAETFGQQAAEYGRKSYEQASAAVKDMTSVKSPTELFRLQSDYARSAFDQLVAESSRNSEMFLKAASDVFQPISNRFAVAAEKVKQVA